MTTKGLPPEDRDRLCSAMSMFDPTDTYHDAGRVRPGYYAAIDRCMALIRGDIEDWQSPPTNDRSTSGDVA